MTWSHFVSLKSPSLRAKCRWSEFEDAADADLKLEEERSQSPAPDPFKFPTDQCIFCAGKQGLRNFSPQRRQRPDSLRRHLENIHLNRFAENVLCRVPRVMRWTEV